MWVFPEKPTFIWEKLTLSADNVFFFQKNPLYLRETHIIWSDNVSFLDKPTLSADNGSFFQKNLVYQTE